MNQVDKIATELSEWLLEAIAVSTQNPIFDRDSTRYDEVIGQAILDNGKKAIKMSITRIQEVLSK